MNDYHCTVNLQHFIRTYDAEAIIDTGAVSTIIPIHVVEKLGLGIRKHTVAEYADGR